MSTPSVSGCVGTAAATAPDCNTGDVKATAERDAAADSSGQSVRSQSETPDQAMAAAVAVAYAMIRAERQALHERLTKLCAPAFGHGVDRGAADASAVAAGDAETRAWRADELQRLLDALLTPQPVHNTEALTAAALRVRAGQSVEAAAVATRTAFGSPTTAVQREAMEWIARSPYGQRYQWAAQHVLATQRHPHFSVAAAFASAVYGYKKLDARDRPSDEAVRCVLDVCLRHGLELNTRLGEQHGRAVVQQMRAVLPRAGAGSNDGDHATVLRVHGLAQYAGHGTASHTPLTMSVRRCAPMARALLSLPASYALGLHTRASSRNAPAVFLAARTGDTWLLCELVRRSGPETVAQWPVFATCAALALPRDVNWPSVSRTLTVAVETHCAVVRELLRVFATDDGHAGGLDLHTPLPAGSALLSNWTFASWLACARAWSPRGDDPLRARMIVACEMTRDAFRELLQRQRVFRDALPAVLSEALRPAPREVCARVSAYVLAPPPDCARDV